MKANHSNYGGHFVLLLLLLLFFISFRFVLCAVHSVDVDRTITLIVYVIIDAEIHENVSEMPMKFSLSI